jgi:hypothetical protein
VLTGNNFTRSKELLTLPHPQQWRGKVLKLVKISPNGKLLKEQDLNANPAGDIGRFNTGAIYGPERARLAYTKTSGGKEYIGAILPKNTALSHQHAIWFVTDLNLEPVQKTSSYVLHSHSYQQRLIADGDRFVSLELHDKGDAHQLTKLKPGSPTEAGTYKRECSIHRLTDIYHWSHVGDLQPGLDGGYAVLFTSYPGNNANADMGTLGWQLGMVHVVKDFDQIDDLEKIVNTDVAQEEVTFNDGTIRRRVKWMTDYSGGDLALRPRMVKYDDGTYIALWEKHKWTDQANPSPEGTTYDSTWVMKITLTKSGDRVKITPDSAKQLEPIDNVAVRLPKNDTMAAIGGAAYWVTGDNRNGSIPSMRLNVHRVTAGGQYTRSAIPVPEVK